MRYRVANVVLVFFAGLCSACAPSIESASTTEIDRRAAEIRSAAESFEPRRIDLTGLSTEGGEANIYIDDEAWFAIAEIYGEMGKTTVEYYFDGGMDPVLIIVEESTYDAPFGQIEDTRTERIYFIEQPVQLEQQTSRSARSDSAIKSKLSLEMRETVELLAEKIRAAHNTVQ